MIRIDLGEEDYAVIYPEMIHRTNRALNNLIETSLGKEAYVEFQKKLTKTLTEDEKKELWRDLSLQNDEEIILLNQVKEWSFGSVTQEVLDLIPSRKYNLLLEEVNKLYSQVPLAGTR